MFISTAHTTHLNIVNQRCNAVVPPHLRLYWPIGMFDLIQIFQWDNLFIHGNEFMGVVYPARTRRNVNIPGMYTLERGIT